MTDNEIIKTLECCINDDCDNCPDTFGNCEHNAMRNALNLINRQQEEIERLKIENQSLRSAANSCKLHYNEARVEAVKEFAYRLKDYYINHKRYKRPYAHTLIDFLFDVTDNLVAELVGERNETV